MLFVAFEPRVRTAMDLGWELTESEMVASTGSECGAFVVSDGWILLVSAFDREVYELVLTQLVERVGGVPLRTCGIDGVGPGARDLGDRVEAAGLCVLSQPRASEVALTNSPVALPALGRRGGSCEVDGRSYVLARYESAADVEKWIASDRPNRDCQEIGFVGSWLVAATEAKPGSINEIMSSLGGKVASSCS